MQVRVEGVQVCELGLAHRILYLAGCGRRRVDGDTMGVYLERGNSFYVPGPDKPYMNLMVDEGSYSGALHLKSEEVGPIDAMTDISYSLPWCEYVDMGDLMRVLVRKLVGEVKYEPGPYIGRGKNQRHEMAQSIAHLKSWSEQNPEHKLRFI